ncbi:hypothetical protein GYMLUDRAFT_229633 [Collybiopsis luxurians FD-317 M1]|uniref:RTA1-domain-containing protein n=1 Tax=Collybiopsis luxurians FD-317 M1 TaxID=944289 RepID=A0A0D0CGJ2_9AGAR|nr:hypothetical protein GYMLUDRAFT_229633 [Collybiopsis luxurians FD-317 M1]
MNATVLTFFSEAVVSIDAATGKKARKSPYGYTPPLGICAMFVAFFSLATLIQFIYVLLLSRRSRHWFVLPTIVLGGCGEITGWAARLWSSQNVLLLEPYTIQLVLLIISPTPILGAHFIIFGKLVDILGPQYSRLKGSWYSRIFLSCDIISLAIQGIGGGWAAKEATKLNTTGSGNPKPGTNLMLAGIAVQAAIIICFVLIAADFLYRYNSDKPVRASDRGVNKIGMMDKRRRVGLYAVFFATLFLFIRAIFRLVELGDGFFGPVMNTEWTFELFDAAMVLLTMYTWVFVPSGWILAEPIYYNGGDVELKQGLAKV